jgi:hypothetical protein
VPSHRAPLNQASVADGDDAQHQLQMQRSPLDRISDGRKYNSEGL